ncbi:MAG: zf-HC2 domain-containing protein [Pyrinomonadaceae bacterium]
MQCSEFRQNLSLYLDHAIAPQLRVVCDEHLRSCPICRAELIESREVIKELSILRKTSVPFDLAASISQSVNIELAALREINQPKLKISRWQNIWEQHLQPQLIPYTTGVLASLLMFTMMFVSLVHTISAFSELEAQSRRERQERELLLAQTSNLPYEKLSSFPAADYAVRRLSIAAESPSLNPQSAFVALTSSLTRGETKNDAMMVVVDVLSNGVANIADVIQSPHESGKLAELDKLLREDPAFVPAALDHRPDNVRIVFLIQKVEVRVIQTVEVHETEQPRQLKTRKSRKF